MKWQDCFELIDSQGIGGWTCIGGDPDMGRQHPKLYDIRNKATGEVSRSMAMPKYTAEYYAQQKFEELMTSVEMSLLT